jgi:acetyl esterase/lipase
MDACKWWLACFVLACAPACGAAPEEKHDLVYDDRFGSATSMDVYVPDGDGPRPGILMIHGGSWKFGGKGDMQGAARRLARSGYVTASIEYRLLPDGIFPRGFQDCACALAYFRSHAAEWKLDPARVVVMGYSAGAHLASLVGVASDHPEIAADCAAAGGKPIAKPAAVISGSGPQDMRAFHEKFSTIEDLFGGPPDDGARGHLYDLGSPIWHVKQGAPPYLLVTDLTAGENDDMEQKLLAVGTDVRMMKVAGSLHVAEQHDDPGMLDVGVSTETPEAWIAIEDFLERTVGAP